MKNLLDSNKLKLKNLSTKNPDKRIEGLQFLVKGLKRKLINFSDYLDILNDKKNMKNKLKSMKFEKNIEESKIIIINRMDEIINHDKFKKDNKIFLDKFNKIKSDFERLSKSEKEIITSSKNINNEKVKIHSNFQKKEEELDKINKDIENLREKSKELANSLDKQCLADNNKKCPDHFKKILILFSVFAILIYLMILFICKE